MTFEYKFVNFQLTVFQIFWNISALFHVEIRYKGPKFATVYRRFVFQAALFRKTFSLRNVSPCHTMLSYLFARYHWTKRKEGKLSSEAFNTVC